MPLTALPTPSPADLALIEQCDKSVRVRRQIELAVVRHMLGQLLAAGHPITVNDGEDFPVKRSTDIEAIIQAAFAVDECWLSVHKGKKELLGVIYLVFGNDGWDVIADYHVSLEELLKPTNDFAEALSAWC